MDTDPFFSFDFQLEEKGYMGEVQHLLSLKRFNVVAGVGYFDSDRDNSDSVFSMPPTISETNIQHTNLYAYSQIKYPDTVTWTIGGSGDFLKGATVDADQFNPKLGITWTPISGTLVRGALFRTLQRTLISSQTIEPTQVAGFNQFFDDAEGVEAWRYGLALDQRIPINKVALLKESSLYVGGEFSKREIDMPFTFFSQAVPGGEIRKADWDEYLTRAYAFWVPHPWFALSFEYQYEKFERNRSFVGPDLFTELKTHRLPLGIRFFHSFGISTELKATYVDQSGEFGDPFTSLVADNDQFWVIDAGLSYRLPKRYGLITLGARNIFDETFKFQDTDSSNPRILPDRQIIGRIILSF